MIDLSSALLSVPPPPPAPVTVADGAVASPGSFARTLGAFLDAKDAVLEPQGALPLVPARQAAAEPGTDLPPVSIEDAETPDPALASVWMIGLPAPVPLAAPAPTPDSAAIAQAAPSATADQPIATVPPRDPAPTELTPPSPEVLAALQTVPPKTTAAGPDALRPTAVTAAKPLLDAVGIAPEPKPAPPAPPLDTAAQAIAVSTLPQPAGQLFASARAIAGSWREHARGEARDSLEVPTSFASATPIELRERAIVQATADAAHTALDLTADSGLQRMIDRIETLRDAADAGDTRVRLIPDALGSIDVAVRQEGERVHVRFTAEHEATRALIAEAQPRLTELAAARGVRIGDTSVSTGGGGGGATPQPRSAPPRAPASARADAATLSTDHRLA